MKKTLFILVAAVTILSACSSNQADKNNGVEPTGQPVQTDVTQETQQPVQTDGTQETEQPAQTADVQETEQPSQTESVSQNNDESANDSTSSNEWSSLPEYDTIIQNIDNKDYTFETVTDNEDKRILLLSNEDGKEQYKTIYVKKTKRLKIIDVDGEGQIYNGVIESK